MALVGGALGASCNGSPISSPSPSPPPALTAALPDYRALLSNAPVSLEALGEYGFQLSVTMQIPAAEAEMGASALSLEAEGAVEFPDRLEVSLTLAAGLASAAEELVVVGDRVWTRRGQVWQTGGGELGALRVTAPQLWATLASTGDLLKAEPQESPETLEGVEAVRFTARGVRLLLPRSLAGLFGLQSAVATLPAVYDVSLWFTREGGWPLRMTIEGSSGAGEEATAFSLELRIQAGDVRIEPPALG